MIDNAGDRIDEGSSASGTDTVLMGIDYTLSAGLEEI